MDRNKLYTPRERAAMNEKYGDLRWKRQYIYVGVDSVGLSIMDERYLLLSERCAYCGTPTEAVQCKACGASIVVY